MSTPKFAIAKKLLKAGHLDLAEQVLLTAAPKEYAIVMAGGKRIVMFEFERGKALALQGKLTRILDEENVDNLRKRAKEIAREHAQYSPRILNQEQWFLLYTADSNFDRRIPLKNLDFKQMKWLAARKPVLRIEVGKEIAVLFSPYKKDFVTALQRAVPQDKRKWARDYGAWVVTKDLANDVADLAETYFQVYPHIFNSTSLEGSLKIERLFPAALSTGPKRGGAPKLVKLDNNTVALQTPYNAEFVRIVKQYPWRKWDAYDKQWLIRPGSIEQAKEDIQKIYGREPEMINF